MGCHSSKEGFSFTHKYEVGDVIAVGAYSSVRFASLRDHTATLPCTVKIVRLVRDGSGIAKSEAGRQDELWQKVGKHDNIVQLIETFSTSMWYFYVMEKCEHSLMSMLSQVLLYTDVERARLFSDMLLGIRHLHQLSIVHRDVRPCNFLFGGIDGCTAKLCDMGIAQLLPKTGYLHAEVGTAPFMSPEMLRCCGYNEKTDVWSFGTTIYILVFGACPYAPSTQSPEEMKDAIRDGCIEPSFVAWPGMPTLCCDQAAAFIRAVLVRDAEKRHSSNEALRLPFFKAVANSGSGHRRKSLDNLKSIFSQNENKFWCKQSNSGSSWTRQWSHETNSSLSGSTATGSFASCDEEDATDLSTCCDVSTDEEFVISL